MTPRRYASSHIAPPRHAPEALACAQLKRDFVPYMEEALELERDGFDTDMLMSMPPLWFDRASRHLRRSALSTLPGTKSNDGKDWPREHAVRKVRMKLSVLVSCDGATTFALTGERFGDMFSDVLKDDMADLLRVMPVAKGKTLTSLAEELIPGCSSKDSPDHWFFEMVIYVNRHSLNSELQTTTLEPPRQQRETWGAHAVGRRVKAKLKGELSLPDLPG
jgi:hypothetical protein